MRRVQSVLWVGMLAAALLNVNASSQTIVQRKRLGNNSEAMTAIHRGPLNGYLVIMDGSEVRAFPNEGIGNGPIQTLFRVVGLPLLGTPSGIAYSDARQQFVFTDPLQVDTLVLSDNNGHPQGSIHVNYPQGFFPDEVEGLVWMPSGSGRFANLIIEAANHFNETSRLEVIDPVSGNVVAEIFPQVFSGDLIVGLTYQAPNHLLLGDGAGDLWQIDFQGNVTAGPLMPFGPDISDLEGVALLDSNRIAVSAYDNGTVRFLDGNLNILTGQDRSDLLGFGLSNNRGLAWDSDTGKHLLNLSQSFSTLANGPQLISVTASLGAETRVADLPGIPQGVLTYLRDEHHIGLSQVGCEPNCVILLYDNNGSLVEQVPVGFALRAMDYSATRKQFVARAQSDPTTLLFIDRSGMLVGSLDLAPIGIDSIQGIAVITASGATGGQLLVASGATHQLYVIDFAGGVHGQFDYRTSLSVMGVRDLAYISTGPLHGCFSLLDASSSEVVIFRLP